jgi:AraC-like DNA-binding protein
VLEAAFNRAFKREAGMPPAAWRRARRGGGATPVTNTRMSACSRAAGA